MLFVIILVGVLGFSSFAWAGNPADLTFLYRFRTGEFFKAAYDGGPRWFSASIPAPGNTVVELDLDDFLKTGSQKTGFFFCFWQNEKNTESLLQARIMRQISANLDIIFNIEISKNKISGDVGIDFRYKRLGLGVITPLDVDNGGIAKFGPRLNLNPISLYFTTTSKGKGGKFISGIRYSGKVVIDIAYASQKSNETWFFRASKGIKSSFGTLIPEIRTKFTPEENFYGIGLGFIPK